MRIIRTDNLKPGMIVSDIPNLDKKMSCIMEFVSFGKEDTIGFRYVGGFNGYYRDDDDGLIYFGSKYITTWNVLNKKEVNKWMKDYKTGTGNAAEK